MKNFLILLMRGLAYVTILAIGSVTGLIKGTWDEADRMARLWEIRMGGRTSPQNQFMYWILRFFGFLLQIFALTVLFHFFFLWAVGGMGL